MNYGVIICIRIVVLLVISLTSVTVGVTSLIALTFMTVHGTSLTSKCLKTSRAGIPYGAIFSRRIIFADFAD